MSTANPKRDEKAKATPRRINDFDRLPELLGQVDEPLALNRASAIKEAVRDFPAVCAVQMKGCTFCSALCPSFLASCGPHGVGQQLEPPRSASSQTKPE